MPLVPVNDQEIFYAARKLDRRPVLLLIHGAGGTHLDWPPELRRFEPFGSCAVDLPGHGRSATPARSTVKSYADDVVALTNKLGLTDIILVGHSMGGAIALDIALRKKDEVIGLILVATGARLKVNQQLLGLVDTDFNSAVGHVVAATWGAGAAPDAIRRATHLMLSCDPATMKMDFMACNDFDIMTQLGQITIPTLVLVGLEDRMTPPKFGRYLADNIPQAEFVSIADSGHMLALERPGIVADAIGEFVSRRITRP